MYIKLIMMKVIKNYKRIFMNKFNYRINEINEINKYRKLLI